MSDAINQGHSAFDDLKPPAASEYLQTVHGVDCSPSYLAWLRSRGGGPRFYLIGRFPHYTRADLDAFARIKTGPRVCSTAEHRAAVLTSNAA